MRDGDAIIEELKSKLNALLLETALLRGAMQEENGYKYKVRAMNYCRLDEKVNDLAALGLELNEWYYSDDEGEDWG